MGADVTVLSRSPPSLPMLDVDGMLVIVGQVGPMEGANTVPLLLGRRRIAGSPIGGIRETQEMLGFCSKKDIFPDCELIRMDQINDALHRCLRRRSQAQHLISAIAPTSRSSSHACWQHRGHV
ncbi:hypothetical protein [Xanthomonas fragariae]|uniref:hypothetical protein n=1 Tax=Xanthomonas fragariae TaxID=48664 RepID=UPI0031BA72CB